MLIYWHKYMYVYISSHFSLHMTSISAILTLSASFEPCNHSDLIITVQEIEDAGKKVMVTCLGQTQPLHTFLFYVFTSGFLAHHAVISSFIPSLTLSLSDSLSPQRWVIKAVRLIPLPKGGGRLIQRLLRSK